MPWLDLSPESVGGPCTHWRNEGGYASEAFGQLQSYGACQTSFMDKQWSLAVAADGRPAGRRTPCSMSCPTGTILESSDSNPIFDEVITCLLNRVPVAAGIPWWGHLVCFLDPILLPAGVAPANTPDGQTVGVLFQNSWGVDWPTPAANGLACLTESRATPDGAAAPVAGGGPPQWSRAELAEVAAA